MLLPKIDICLVGKCNLLSIYEKTGLYVPENNPKGWGAPDGINTSQIQSAVLEILDCTQTETLATYILKNEDNSINVFNGVAGSPTPGSFLALKEQEWNLPDGMYSLKYTITDTSEVSYVNEDHYKLFLCNFNNCISSVKKEILSECSDKKLNEITHTVKKLEILEYGIKSAFSCGDCETVNKLLEHGKRFCDNLCDSGCSDC